MNAKLLATAATVTLSLFVALVAPHATARGDAAEGQKKAETCKACHGEGGAKPIQNDYPVLAGQQQDYLAAVLTQYKTGKRKNAVMAGFAAALTKQDIQDLSTYFASQPSVLNKKY